MDRVAIITEDIDGLVMMPVHVARQEIKDGQINQVRKTSAFAVRSYLADCVTITII